MATIMLFYASLAVCAFKPAPDCGQRKRFNIHGYAEKDRIVCDVNIGLMQIDMAIRVPQYRCDKCPSTTFNHQFESIEYHHRTTKRLCEQIRKEAFSAAFSDIAANHRASETTVVSFFDECVAELEENRAAIVAPSVLGIDEKAHCA